MPTKESKRTREQQPGVWSPELTDDFLDATTFEQLLDMDDDDQREFSKGIVWNYFDQVRGAFGPIEGGMYRTFLSLGLMWNSRTRDLQSLSSLGHFLKGSSAAVGLIKLKASCEKIQNYGNRMDETGNHSISEDDALSRIAEVLVTTKKDFRDAEVWLKRFYGEDPGRDNITT